MHFHGTTLATPEVVGSNDIHEVLTAYVLDMFSNYRLLSDESQVQFRFCLKLTVQGLVTVEQLGAICQQFEPHTGSAAQVLTTLMTNPLMLAPRDRTYHWSSNEDLLLLAGVTWGRYIMLHQLLPHRPADTWKSRLKLIVKKLESTGALAPVQISQCSNRQFVSLESISLPPKATSSSIKQRKHRLVKQARTMTEKRMLRRKCSRLQSRVMTAEKRVKQMQKSMARLTVDSEEEEMSELTADQNGDSSGCADEGIQIRFLQEICALSVLGPRQRVYSEFMLEISQLLALTSRKTYRLLKQILPLPCESCLRYHYAEAIRETKMLLTSEDTINEHIHRLVSDEKARISAVTIGIDAFSFRTFHETTTFKSSRDKESKSNAFVFVHVPLDADAPVKVLFLKSKSNGAFDASVNDAFSSIVASYSSHNLKIWFKATDGDRFMNSEHNAFYTANVENDRGNFYRLMRDIHPKLVEGETILPIADPLHFAKNLRGKLIDHNVAVVNDKVIHFVSGRELQSVLALGPALDDKSQTGRMRDVYVTRLFTLENICRLMRANCFHAAFLLMPYACLFTVMYSDNLTNLDRMFLVHLSYICYDIMLDENAAIVRQHRKVGHRFSRRMEGVTSAEPTSIRKMIHTCLGFGIALFFGPKYLRLDALGTHLVENSIGIARCVSNSSEYSRIVSAFANSEMRKTLAKKLGLTLHIPKRITDGGAKVCTIDTQAGRIPASWDPQAIAELMKKTCSSERQEKDVKEYKLFTAALEDVVSGITIRRLSTPSEVANALIMQRNYAYNGSSESFNCQ